MRSVRGRRCHRWVRVPVCLQQDMVLSVICLPAALHTSLGSLCLLGRDRECHLILGGVCPPDQE